MNPQRFLTRTALIEYVYEHTPRSVVRDAIDTGMVRVCGAFMELPPHTAPGFVLEITSRHGRTWTVAVKVDQIKHTYSIVTLDETPWRFWDGQVGRDHPVYDGDCPEAYANYKRLASTGNHRG